MSVNYAVRKCKNPGKNAVEGTTYYACRAIKTNDYTFDELAVLPLRIVMITRCYLEITNVCNLDCVFCPKTHRAKHTLTPDEFETLTDRLQGEVRFLWWQWQWPW